MKILVALNNEYIFKRLEEIYKEEIHTYDIVDMESVIEFLAKASEPYILVTKDNLDGCLNNRTYIKQIKLANEYTKVIYIVEELIPEYKEFLFANEVFNIVEGETLTIASIKECIEEDKNIVYKSTSGYKENLETHLNEAAFDYVVESQVVPKQLIAIYGTSGSGKSSVTGIVSKAITKTLNISVALLDMDIQNPSIDILNNIDGNTNVLSQFVEDVDKRNEINKLVEKYMIKDKENKNLWYMTNNTSLFDCQNKLDNKYYSKIYSSISMKYDYTIVDLPASPFLDVVPYTLLNATKIFFVLNPNYISIRQAMKYLDLITKLWDVPKERIFLIVNKLQKNSLDNYQIESILKGFKVVANIEYDKNMESYINGATPDIKVNLDMSRVYEVLDIKKDLNKSVDNNKANKKRGMIRSGIFVKKIEEKVNGNKSV